MISIALAFVAFVGQTGGARESFDLHTRVEETVREALASHCGAQCELVGVDLDFAERDAKPDTAAPGFSVGATTPARVLRRVKARVAYDASVSKEFRAQIAKLLELRVRRASGETQVKVVMNETSFAFPKPLPALPAPTAASAHTPAASPVAAPQFIPIPQYLPQPAPAPAAAPVAAPVPPAAPKPIERVLEERLIENIPLFAALLAAIVIAAFVVRAIGRRGGAAGRTGPQPSDADAIAPRAREQRDSGFAHDAGAELALLRAELAAKPQARAAIARTFLDERAVDEAARFVQLFGADALNGERARTERREIIGAILERIATLRAPSSRELADLVYAFRTRLTQFELAHPEGTTARFEALVAAPAEIRAAALKSLTHAEQVEVLSRIPARVRATYVAALPAEEERDLLKAFLDRDGREATPDSVLASVERRLNERVQAAVVRADRAKDEATVFEEVLASRSTENVRSVVAWLAEQRPELCDELLARVPLDGSARLADDDALATALLGVAPDQLCIYLAEIHPAERARWIAACPTRLRTRLGADVERAVMERAGRRGATTDEESRGVLDARRAVTRALGDALRAQRAPIAEINRAVLSGNAPIRTEEASA